MKGQGSGSWSHRISPTRLAILRFVRTETAAGRAPTIEDVARAVNRSTGTVIPAVAILRRDGHMVPAERRAFRALALTPAGEAALDNPPQPLRAKPKKPAARPKPVQLTLPVAVHAPVPSVFIPAAPVVVHRPKRREDYLPPVPAGFDPNAPRAVRHPGMPRPAERPATMKPGEWFRLSAVPRHPLHDLCARGMW